MTRDQQYNAELNAAEYRAKDVILRSCPTEIFVELTQNCNASCQMCRSAFRYDANRNMPDELFAKIADELFPYVSLVDLHGWGESTIAAGFSSKLAAAIQAGVRVRLVTNGLAMTERLWSLLFYNGARNIAVLSVDTPDPKTFADLGRGDLAKVMRNVAVGVAIKESMPENQIYLNAVVSSVTLRQLPELVRLAARTGVDRLILQPIACVSTHPLSLSGLMCQVRDVLDESTALARDLNVLLQLGAALHPEAAVSAALPSVCSNPWSNALVDYKGRVGFCHHMLNKPQRTFGSLMDNKFRELWNCTEFVALRRQHLAAERSRCLSVSECSWCYKNRYSEPSLADYSAIQREVSTVTRLSLHDIGSAVAHTCRPGSDTCGV